MSESARVEAVEAEFNPVAGSVVVSQKPEKNLFYFFPDGSFNLLASGIAFTKYAQGRNDELAIHYVASIGDVDALELVLRNQMRSDEYINFYDSLGLTPLHLASNREVVNHMLVNGANPDLPDSNWQTPLMVFLNSALYHHSMRMVLKYNEYFYMACEAFELADLASYNDYQKGVISSIISQPPFLDIFKDHPKAQYLKGWAQSNTKTEDTEIAVLEVELGKKMMEKFSEKMSARTQEFKDSLVKQRSEQLSLEDLIISKIFSGSIFIYYPNGQINWLATGVYGQAI